MKLSYNESNERDNQDYTRMKERNDWTSRFIKATIIQMMLASVLTLFLVLALHGPLRLLSFLIAYNASDAPFAGTWFNFSHITYLTATGITRT